MTLIVDASVALQWYLREPGADAARQILAGDEVLVAPDLVVAEVCNVSWLARELDAVSTTASIWRSAKRTMRSS
jgi:predicted nucleic acid-binding protein